MNSKNLFETRSKLFGIDGVKHKRVIIDKSTMWNDFSAPFEVKTIKIKDLDEVKRLIGNPDEHFEQKAINNTNHMSLTSGLDKITIENVKNAAHSYVFGNSKPLKKFKSDIENIIGEVSVQVVNADIIEISEPLNISDGQAKALAANQIIFKDNGQIICLGTLTIHANTITNLKANQ